MSLLKKALIFSKAIKLKLEAKMPLSVKGLAGVASMASFGYGLYRAYKGDYKAGVYCGFGAIGAAYAYQKLDKRDIESKETEYKHKERVEEIRHRCPSTSNKASVEDSEYEDDAENTFELPQTYDEYVDSKKDVFAPEPVVGCMIHKGDVCFIAAKGGIGKSIWLMDLCVAISKGSYSQSCPPFFKEFVTSPQNTLYIDTEMKASDIKARYGDTKLGTDKFFYVQNQYNTLADLFDYIKKIVESKKEDFVIGVDNLVDFSINCDKEAIDLKNLINGVQNLAQKLGITVTLIILCHTNKNKNEMYRGNGKIRDFASVFVIMTEVEESIVKVEIDKNRNYMPEGCNCWSMRRCSEPNNPHFEFYEPQKDVTDEEKETIIDDTSVAKKGPNTKITNDDILLIGELDKQGLTSSQILSILKEKGTKIGCPKTVENYMPSKQK